MSHVNHFPQFWKFPPEIREAILKEATSADALVEPIQQPQRYRDRFNDERASAWNYCQAGKADEEGNPVPWPQTPDKLSASSKEMETLVSELPWLFIHGNRFLLPDEATFLLFFASQKHERLKHYNEVVVSSNFGAMDWQDHHRPRPWYKLLDHVMAFVGELSPNLRFTVEVEQPEIDVLGDFVDTLEGATDWFVYVLENVNRYINMTPIDERCWVNLPGFDVAINIGGHQQFSLRDGNLPPVGCGGVSLQNVDVRTELTRLSNTLRARRQLVAQQPVSFKMPPQQLVEAYYGSELDRNGLELDDTSRFTNGKLLENPLLPKGALRPVSHFTRSKCRPYDKSGVVPQDRPCYKEVEEDEDANMQL